MMKSICRENARKEERGDARKREEKEIKRRGAGDGERKRFQPDSTHRGESPSAPSPHIPLPLHRHGTHTHTHTFLRNEPDYWLNPDRGITYSVKSSFSQGEPNGESTRDRDRDEGCVHAGLPRRNPSPLSPLAPFVRPPFPRHVPREDSSWIHVNVRECG